jgi:hypothetical protein
LSTWLCVACGTQYPPAASPPESCPICDDPRQSVPYDTGQQWVEWETFLAAHAADIRDDHGILGVGCTPGFAIGQRALLVESPAGNVLWDCTAYLDAEIEERISRAGGLAAIAISHPHYYTAMVEWAHTFDCPVHLHEAERKWVLRPDPAISFWSGETHDLGGGLTLVRGGGHFEGAQMLHWAERRALLCGDVVQVIPDRSHVSFMWSYPNLVPLAPAQIEALVTALAPFPFDSIYGAWFDRVIESDGSAIVRRSAERYVRAITGAGQPS